MFCLENQGCSLEHVAVRKFSEFVDSEDCFTCTVVDLDTEPLEIACWYCSSEAISEKESKFDVEEGVSTAPISHGSCGTDDEDDEDSEDYNEGEQLSVISLYTKEGVNIDGEVVTPPITSLLEVSQDKEALIEEPERELSVIETGRLTEQQSDANGAGHHYDAAEYDQDMEEYNAAVIPPEPVRPTIFVCVTTSTEITKSSRLVKCSARDCAEKTR